MLESSDCRRCWTDRRRRRRGWSSWRRSCATSAWPSERRRRCTLHTVDDDGTPHKSSQQSWAPLTPHVSHHTNARTVQAAHHALLASSSHALSLLPLPFCLSHLPAAALHGHNSPRSTSSSSWPAGRRLSSSSSSPPGSSPSSSTLSALLPSPPHPSTPLIRCLQFFGDSFSAGTGATSSLLRFSSLISSHLGALERNSALGGTNWPQLCQQAYSTQNDDGVSPSHILTSYNDNQQGPTPTLPGLSDQDLSNHAHCMMDALLFLGTRAADKQSFDGSSTTLHLLPSAAQWASSPYFDGYGTTTSSNGAAAVFTLTGRYVVVSALVFAAADHACYWRMEVDGMLVNAPLPMTINPNPNSSSVFQPVTFLYDTQSQASTVHSVRMTNLAVEGKVVHLSWAVCITPYVTVNRSVWVGDAQRGWWSAVPNGGGSEMRRQVLSRMLQDVVAYCSATLQLDVHWVPYRVMWNLAHLNDDHIHPNNAGHREYAQQYLAYISQ